MPAAMPTRSAAAMTRPAARAGPRPGSGAPAGCNSRSEPSCMAPAPSLRDDNEVIAAVLRPAALVIAMAERRLLPEAPDDEPIGRHAKADEIVARGFGAPVAKRDVVLGGSALVAVPFQGDAGPRPFRQPRRVPLENGAAVVAQR